MSAKKYKAELFEAVQNLLWRQWTALGIPGHASVKETENVLDPEALLIFSAGFARYDQRLYDLILDWLQIHSSQINVQRLKALLAKAEWRDSASLGYMAAVTAETDKIRWQKQAHICRANHVTDPEVLFRDSENRPESFIPKQDLLALHCGFLRNLRQRSGKIPSLLPQTPATLLLRIRGVLGISARAETLLMLLAARSCKVQEIAERSGFTWKSVQDALGELERGNWITSVNGKGRGKQYLLNEPDKFLRLFGVRTLSFSAWTKIYDAIGLLWQSCVNPALAEVLEETFQNELRTLFRDQLQSKLLACGHPALEQSDRDLLAFPKLLKYL